MPSVPTPADHAFFARITQLEQRVKALETQQQMVFVDPTGATGDPAHGHALFVTGWLGSICGINAYGAASYRTGAWLQI